MASTSPSISPSVSLSPSLSPSVSPSVSLSPSKSPSLSPSLSPSISPSVSPSEVDLYYPPTVNGLQKTLGAQLDAAETTTCTLNNTTNLQNERGLFVIDRIDTAGVEKDASLREYISFGEVSGSTVITLERGLGGTTDQTHAVGAVVEFVADVVQQQALINCITEEHSAKGVHDTTKVVSLTGTQTLTNKTLTSPVINTGVSGTAEVTTASSTQTLTNKTLTSPVINTGVSGTAEVTTASSTQTLTNKRITPRIVTTTDDATAAIDCDVTDQYQLTAVANATTFTVTGTPVAGQKLLIRAKDAGVAKGLTWDAVFNAVGVTLPTTTVASKTHYIGCVYNATSSKWDALAVAVEA